MKKIIAKKAAEERGKRSFDRFLLPNANLVTDRLGDPSPSNSQCLVPDLYNRGEAETILVPKQQEISSVEDNNKTDEDSFDVLTTDNLDSEKTIDESEQINVNKDPGTWGRLDIKTRDLLVLGKPQGIPSDNSGRPFPTSILSKKLSNGESANRDWISWSIEKSAFFCYPCCLFEDRSIENKQLSNFVKCGVSDNWKKIYDRVKDHESNVNHVNNYVKWKELVITLKGKKSGIDDSLLKCIREEEEKRRRILTAVIDVILFLSERNLPFRGTNSTVDKDDCGIFLSTLKLLGRYNSDIKDHLDSLARAKESGKKLQAHYLSWRTQNDFLIVRDSFCPGPQKSSGRA
ncbi:uncharacterized protein LOC130447881 [Diorhabda sublineata]|uniref:uncharacterized protein LOC130447881 n=1 Tax=Diorhabda sublineata TaxID=1163346 RepID=UPI0024E0F788|nr:uncharacterized protein LOC130447881 [Diorhabda sublineata]